MLTGLWRDRANGAGCFGEAGCGCRLGNAFDFHKRLTRHIVGVLDSFFPAQDWCKAHVGAFHDGRPFIACLGLENGGDLFRQNRPIGAVKLVLEGRVCNLGLLQ